MNPIRCYIGLGSNLAGDMGSPAGQLRRAEQALADEAHIELLRVSTYYRSAAVGPAGQPDYCNAVAEILTEHPPLGLLDTLQQIEARQGRDRDNEERWGPRTLDLDVLLYGDAMIDDSRLTVPHPQIRHREFVLLPLAEIASALDIPGLGPIEELVAGLPADRLSRWSES